MTAVVTGTERDALQRRTLNTLRLGVVPGQAAVAGVVAVVSLLGKDMLGSDRLGGLGSAAFTTGVGDHRHPVGGADEAARPALAGW